MVPTDFIDPYVVKIWSGHRYKCDSISLTQINRRADAKRSTALIIKARMRKLQYLRCLPLLRKDRALPDRGKWDDRVDPVKRATAIAVAAACHPIIFLIKVCLLLNVSTVLEKTHSWNSTQLLFVCSIMISIATTQTAGGYWIQIKLCEMKLAHRRAKNVFPLSRSHHPVLALETQMILNERCRHSLLLYRNSVGMFRTQILTHFIRKREREKNGRLKCLLNENTMYIQWNEN